MGNSEPPRPQTLTVTDASTWLSPSTVAGRCSTETKALHVGFSSGSRAGRQIRPPSGQRFDSSTRTDREGQCESSRQDLVTGASIRRFRFWPQVRRRRSGPSSLSRREAQKSSVQFLMEQVRSRFHSTSSSPIRPATPQLFPVAGWFRSALRWSACGRMASSPRCDRRLQRRQGRNRVDADRVIDIR